MQSIPLMHGLTADYLFPIALEVVKHLECADFKAISLTGDKASPNRKFICMHCLFRSLAQPTKLKVLTALQRDTYTLFSDVPHLIKPSETVGLINFATRELCGYVIYTYACTGGA